MFVALLVGVSGRSAGAAKLARASAAKSSGRAELATGAWAMSDAYINRTATKSASQVQQLFCARGFHLHSVPTRALRSASYYWYFKKNILVFEREPPTAWVDAPIASEMARQGTDMRRCGQHRCCRSAVEAQCIRGLRRNTTCMTAWLEA